MINSNVIFPSQKKSYNEKNEEWKKKCVDAGEAACIWKNEGLRKSFYTKRINYNLYSDILDQEDIEANQISITKGTEKNTYNLHVDVKGSDS